jgi:Co/Zn/Cd efflux system component
VSRSSHCRRHSDRRERGRFHPFGQDAHAANLRFAFGTGKLGELAGYTSAVVLGMIALLIGYQSVDHVLHPVAIAYREAIAIASLGLAVNVISAWLLRGEHDASTITTARIATTTTTARTT